MRIEPDAPAKPMGYGQLWQPSQETGSNLANLFGLELQLDLELVNTLVKGAAGKVRIRRIEAGCNCLAETAFRD